MFEPFRFQIEDAYDIFRDPGGHYHHFTTLWGYLLEGTIRPFQTVAIPGKSGQIFVSRVVNMTTNFKLVDELSMNIEQPVGIGLWKPAPLSKDIERGIMEWFHNEETFDRLGLLQSYPRVYLHKIRSTGDLCTECPLWIFSDTNGIPVLKELSSHPDAETAELANMALRWYERQRDAHRMYEAARRKKWWQFWR